MAELIAARDWLTVCQLPPYARELNPLSRPGLLDSFLASTCLDLTPFCNPAIKRSLGTGAAEQDHCVIAAERRLA
jgi:hypothetical protein